MKLRHLDDWTEARRANAERYDALLADYRVADAIRPPVRLPERRHVFNQYVTRVTNGRRDEVVSKMRSAGVGAAVYYPKPLHLQTCFADLGYERGQLPVAERACEEVMALPIFAELGEERQEIVVRTLCRSLGRQAVPSRPRVMRAAA